MSDTTQDPSNATRDPDDVYDGEEIQLLVILPFMGPGMDTETGQLVGPPQDAYVLHSTQLRLKPDQEVVQRFEQQSVLILEQLGTIEGLLGFSFGYEPRRNFFRTMGVWRSAEAMDSFVNRGAHLQAMNGAGSVSFRTRGHHWAIPAREMPPRWEAAIAGLASRDAGVGSTRPPVVTTISLTDPSEAVGMTPHEIFQIATEKLRKLRSAAGVAP